MSVIWETVNPVLQDFIVTLLGGVLALLSAFLVACAKKFFNWLGTKVESIKNEESRAAVRMANESLEKIVINVVAALAQTLADDIKQSIKNNDGRYTQEDLIALKEVAYEHVMNQLTDATEEVLNTVYKDLKSHILDMIETNVRLLKSQDAAKEAIASGVNPLTVC